jgi:hypothetical protein
LNWKFWKKEDTKDETVIEVKDVLATTSTGIDKSIYVKAQSPEKALDLYHKLKEEVKKRE